MIDVAALNAWSPAEAEAAFLRCCGSTRWAEQMVAQRPFANEEAVRAAATRTWQSLEKADWLEAFAAHPRIGDVEALRARFATAAWSAAEQAGVAGAGDAVLHALADANRAYEQKFGYRFIICATGKSAAEMLALLQARLRHEPAVELPVAAAEQAKILHLRLQKLFA